MMETYRKFGLKGQQLFYTDNVIADQCFLGEVVPSLLKDVVPVSTSTATLTKNNNVFAALPTSKLPAHVQINVLINIADINKGCDELLNAGNQVEKLCIDFDCEWAKSTAP